MKNFNEADGLIHNPDGTKEFLDGTLVTGANDEDNLIFYNM